MSVVAEAICVAEDACDEFAVDGFDLTSSGELEGVGGDAIDVAQAAVSMLVEQSESVGVEDVAVAAGLAEAMSDVLGGVGRCRFSKCDACWMRDQSERFFASERRCRVSGRPTRTSESSARLSHS